MGLLMDPSVPFPQPRHWVIGDIHGCHSCMVALLDVLPKKDHLIFCGDVINGGPQIEACKTLAWDLMRCGQATWLRGNHEQRLIEALALEGADGEIARKDQDTVKQMGDARCRSWQVRLNQLPLVYRADGWSATHAGFDADGEPDLSIRDPFWTSYDGRFGRVVIGHTPRFAVERHQHIVLIDTGAVYGGKLSAYCPETDQVIQVQGLQGPERIPHLDHDLLFASHQQGDQVPC